VNRRGFLTSLIALGAAPLLSKLPIVYDALSPIRLEVAGDGLIYGFSFQGMGSTSLAAMVEISRGALLCMRYGLNEMGGMVAWRARPGDELVFTKRHPIVISLPRRVDGFMTYEAHGRNFLKRISDGMTAPLDADLVAPVRYLNDRVGEEREE
jgi:hypothetical protein